MSLLADLTIEPPTEDSEPVEQLQMFDSEAGVGELIGQHVDFIAATVVERIVE